MTIPIVDEQDRIINQTLGEDIDDDIDGIYRVAGVWIISGTGEVLLSRRSLSKPRSPGLWGPAVLGIVEENNTYESTAIARAFALIGLEIGSLIETPKIFIETSRKYFVQFFVHVLPYHFSGFMLNPAEVAEVRWFSKGEIEEMILNHPENFAPVFFETYENLKAY